MLKQAAPSRSLRARGFKVKHALQIFIFLAISTWLLYQAKRRSHTKNYVFDPSSFPNLTENIKFGRKDLNPMLRDHDLENPKKLEKDEVSEINENKVEEIDALESRGGGDDEIDGNDQERTEEEEEDSDLELEDLIDEEDREKEEAIVVDEETVESSQPKEFADDASLTRNEVDIGSLRKVKEGVRFLEKKGVEFAI